MIIPPTDCPVCQRIDCVQRVPAIHRSSFSTHTRMQMRTTYDTNNSPHTTTVPVTETHQTPLGSLLNPPRPGRVPLDTGEQLVIVLGFILMFVVFYSFGKSNFFNDWNSNLVLAFFAMTLTLPLWTWILARFVLFRKVNRERRERQQQEKEIWQYRYQQWEQFCYCSRCDAVFVSGTSEAVSPQQIEQLYT
ncbi:MAG: hypothetical protein J2P37_25945 [Ktedonobacteraceae bacterium]|nr:hypothetical protein [Ktedonobacteraceae bacterium]MBO0794379.1 hypothetical protein [Ktedonobacteraceae bacterium]